MPESMRAVHIMPAAAGSQRVLKLVELPVPEPSNRQVRLRVRACGVCHTDLHILEGEIDPSLMPIIPGHQVVGVVEALGPDIQPGEESSSVTGWGCPGFTIPTAHAATAGMGKKISARTPALPGSM